MTEVEGKLSLGLRTAARSGAETGGGTTVAWVSGTGELESSRLTPPGTGGIILAARAEFERECSAATLGAGATTAVVRDGAFSVRSREALGAGGRTAGRAAGATRVWSPETFGAGGIRAALNLGAVRERSRAADGAGAITDSS